MILRKFKVVSQVLCQDITMKDLLSVSHLIHQLCCNLVVTRLLSGLDHPGFEVDGSHDRVVVPRQVVKVLRVLGPGLLPAQEVPELQQVALVGDRLYVVLVRVTGGKQAVAGVEILHPASPQGGALDLRRVVEPPHLHLHVPGSRGPHAVDPPDVGPVRPAGGEEDSAVPDLEALAVTFPDCFMKDSP